MEEFSQRVHLYVDDQGELAHLPIDLVALGKARLLPVGSKAPDFRFTQLPEGGQADSSQFSGRILVLELWASWCGPCIKALSKLDSLRVQHPEWTGKVDFVAVSVDENIDDAVAVLKRTQWSHISTVWAGPDILRLYRVSGLPTMFVIDAEGKVAAVKNVLDVSAVVTTLLQRSTEEDPRTLRAAH